MFRRGNAEKERGKMTEQNTQRPGPQRMSEEERKKRRRQRWFRQNGPTLILFLLFGVCCFIIGLLVGGGSGAEKAPETQASGERTAIHQDGADSGAALQSSTLPVTTTEAPATTVPATTDWQDAIDDATTRTIYLTFDDGPGKYTYDVLEILDKCGVKATFFTIGYYVDHYPDQAKAIVDHGNLIACHSYTHEYKQCYASVEAFMDEVEQWKQAVQNATGTVPDRICIRFPGRSTTPNAKNVADGIKSQIILKGYRWFDWNAANNDKYPKGNTKGLSQKDYFIDSYKQSMGWYANDDSATVIFITHETEKTTVDTLEYMIKDALERGYTFKTLDHHPEWNN